MPDYYLLTNYEEFLHNHTILNGDYSLVNDSSIINKLDPTIDNLFSTIKDKKDKKEREREKSNIAKQISNYKPTHKAQRERQKALYGNKIPHNIKTATEKPDAATLRRIMTLAQTKKTRRERFRDDRRQVGEVAGGKKKKFMKGGNIVNVRQKYLWSFAPIDQYHDFKDYNYIENYKKHIITTSQPHAWKKTSVERYLYHDVLKEIHSIDNNYLENYYTIIPIHENSPFLQSDINNILYLEPKPSKDLTLYEFPYYLKERANPSNPQIHTIQGSVFDNTVVDTDPKSFAKILESLNFPQNIKCLSDGYPQSENYQSKSDLLIKNLKDKTKAFRSEIFPAELIFDMMMNNGTHAYNYLNDSSLSWAVTKRKLNILQKISYIISGKCAHTWCTAEPVRNSKQAAIDSLLTIIDAPFSCSDTNGYLNFPGDFSLSSVPFSLLTRQLFNSVYVLTHVTSSYTTAPGADNRIVTGLLFTKSFLNSLGQTISNLIRDCFNPDTIFAAKDYRFAIVTQENDNEFYTEVRVDFDVTDPNILQMQLKNHKNYLCLLFENYQNSPFSIKSIKKYITKLENNLNPRVTTLVDALSNAVNGKGEKTFNYLSISPATSVDNLIENIFNVMVHYIIIHCWRAKQGGTAIQTQDDEDKKKGHIYDIYIPMLEGPPDLDNSNYFDKTNYINYIKFILTDFKKAGDAGKVWFNWITHSCPDIVAGAGIGETYLETNEYLCAIHGILKNSYVMAAAGDSFDNIRTRMSNPIKPYFTCITCFFKIC